MEEWLGSLDQLRALQRTVTGPRNLAQLQTEITEAGWLHDELRGHLRMIRQIAEAYEEYELAGAMYESSDRDEQDTWEQARQAIRDLYSIVGRRQELAAIVGPSSTQLSAGSLHPKVWDAAAAVWASGQYRLAVHNASRALEQMLQNEGRTRAAGQDLGNLFILASATPTSPRLRVDGIDEDSPTWRSVHEGAGFLVRGAMMAVRNLVSHPGWPEPSEAEGLEMLAVLSYAARLVDRSSLEVSSEA